MESNLTEQIRALGRRSRAAARRLAALDSAAKNAALESIAAALEQNAPALLAANARDLEAGAAKGLSAAMLDRLKLTETRVRDMARGVREVAALTDPVGQVIASWTRPNGLEISKIRVPIGVVGIIYESRPNVTCDAAVLCLKTGNATLLRGGSEAIHSNIAIAAAMREGGARAGLPDDAVLLIETTDREAVGIMAGMDEFIDVIVPRGGHGLIEAVVRAARMPVIKHYHGVCHVFVDRAADPDMAARIAVNAKCQRPSTCNAMETLLVDRPVAEGFLRALAPRLAERKVALKGDAESRRILGPSVEPASEADYRTEYNDLILNLRVVDGVAEAVDHIETYGSHHSDTIVTADRATAERFLAAVDSAAVYWNASTRFTDGGEFGFGAEIGISTDKLHARGPMGLEELTSYKYVVRGTGQVRGE